jgi:chromosome segregation ATPase
MQAMSLSKQDLEDVRGVIIETVRPLLDEVINPRFDVLEERMDSLEGKVDGLEDKVDKLDGRIDRLETAQNETSRRLTSIESKIDTIGGRLEAIENDIKELYSMTAARDTGLDDKKIEGMAVGQKLQALQRELDTLAKQYNVKLHT